MNRQHPQLDPLLNRTRVPGRPRGPVPGEAIDYPEVDPEAPYRNTYLGFIETPIVDVSGNRRDMLAYIPVTEKSAWNMALVILPGGVEARAFIEENGWIDALEKHCMTGFFLPCAECWGALSDGDALDCAVRALAEMRRNRWFQSNAPGIYCVGFGDGAKVAALFAITHASVLAGWAACGATGLDPALLDSLGNGPSDCEASIPRREVPLPALILDDQKSNVVDYFIRANRAVDEGLRNDLARVYRQRPILGESYVNDPAVGEVWHGPEQALTPALAERMLAFLERFKRWAGWGNGHIRPTIHAEEDGMRRTDRTIGGLKRYWLTFEPSAWKRDPQAKRPLVIAIHGFTCTGEFFANNSGWHAVGEERGAFVVFPTAYPFKRRVPSPMGPHIATPEWNAGGMGRDTSDGPDELEYFRALLEDTMAKYPIDPTRVYVTGHSNGAMMTQRLMRCMPKAFAGFAPVGFMEALRGGMEDEPADGVLRNVWYTMGEFDGQGCALEAGNVNMVTIEKLCRHNGCPLDARRHYESGIYMHSLWRDAAGVPLVRFTGIRNWPHTYTPELAFMIYDEFFARFIRRPDGTLEYLA